MLATLLALGAAAGCQEPAQHGESRGSTTPRYERAESPSPLEQSARPVRVGELGPSFAACSTIGTTRRRVAEAGGALLVRAAPYENAEEADRLPTGSTFFVCSRSIDQKWLGIVYGGEGEHSDLCGVSRPIPTRRDYDGPCRSGWVASAFVTMIARPAREES